MRASAIRPPLQGPDAEEREESDWRRAATQSVGRGAVRADCSHSLRRKKNGNRPDAAAVWRQLDCPCGRPARTACRPGEAAGPRAPEAGRPACFVPFYASRTKASSLVVRVLPPLTPRRRTCGLPFYYEWRGDRVTLFDQGRASHTFLPFSQFDASHARHVQQSHPMWVYDIETLRFLAAN